MLTLPPCPVHPPAPGPEPHPSWKWADPTPGRTRRLQTPESTGELEVRVVGPAPPGPLPSQVFPEPKAAELTEGTAGL